MYERISSNVRKTWVLIFVFIAARRADRMGRSGYFTDVGFWGLGDRGRSSRS